jgi:MFS transporter, Spinster family, sphingosine-1-phosphate transporter
MERTMPPTHHDGALQRNQTVPGGATKIPGAGLALTLLLLINLFNYIDRYILAAVEPDIRREFFGATEQADSGAAAQPEDPAAKAKTGLLATAFMVSYMVTAPLFGFLAERFSRWLLVAAGVALWSLASGASGLAHDWTISILGYSLALSAFTAMFLTRCFVGIGEGAYGPVAPALISDFFPVQRRGRVMAWFYMAIPVGSALGYVVGGWFAKLNPAGGSWRWAFFAVVPPGLLLGLWAMFMRESPRGAADPVAAAPRRPSLRDYAILLRTPSYAINTLGMTAMTFAIGAISYWMPGYLADEGVTTFLGFEPREFLGVVTVITGLTATLAGGLLGDALRRRFPGSYFLVSGAGLCLAVPCTLLMVMTPFPLAWLWVFLAEFFLFFNTGPANTILANVSHPSIRATAFALNILIIHLFGDAISPTVVGWIAGLFGGRLGPAFLALAGVMLLGGILWLFGARHLQRDTAAAPHQLG